ncbi:MAG: patatin-like phospholipase family protein [Bacteroidetes bacterium]|nr:patatin-like phospholipase family protein [Bacteroidota bacterium]
MNWLRLNLLYCVFFFLNIAQGQQVAVVLSGGGAKAFSHIGVLMALEENDVPIDYVVGNSMGALIGALYASGYSPIEIQAMLIDPAFISLNKLNDERKVRFYQHKEPNASFASFPFYIQKGLRFDIPFEMYDLQYVDFKMMNAFATATAAANYQFDSLMVPFRCIAADIDASNLVVFREGNLAKAVRASMTFPLFIRPVEIEGKMLFDGGMYNNFPVDVAFEEFSPDFIIGSKAVRNFSKANPDDLVSLLQNMLMQKANYTIDSAVGFLIETTCGDEGIFHFSRIQEYIDSGYVAATRMMPELKKRLPHSHSKASKAELRQEFTAKKPNAYVNNVKFLGVNDAQQHYFKQILGLKKQPGFNLETIDHFFVKLYRNENVKSVYPSLIYYPHSKGNELELEINLTDPLAVDIGGYISSSGVNEGYVGLDYMQLGKTAKHFSVSTNFGTFYNSVAGLARIEFPARLPLIIQAHFSTSRKNYFSSARYFFEDQFPAYILLDENYFELAGIVPAKQNGLFTLGFSNLNLNFRYYQDNYFSRNDTSDVSNFYFATPFIEYEYETLNRKQFASRGKYLLLGLNTYFGTEHTIPGSKSEVSMEIKRDLNFYSLVVRYQQYWKIASLVNMGISFDLDISNKPVLSNYVSSLLLSSPFEPLEIMKTKFLESYRAPSSGGLGLITIFELNRQFELRINGYLYVPYQKIILADNGRTPLLSEPFSHHNVAASTQLVYHPPIGVISASVNYLDQQGQKFGFLLNLGYLLFNKSRFYR